ncbi:MAG: carboxypeptidase regulatory-like domain-containing protein [Deltaproteobacteria bacterium]|nr:carboxypeptidase regulatory-like domain-containing protein [Deltaproteobacteria bacterium]
MKRAIAAGLVALAVALVVWRTAARSATSTRAGSGSAASSTAAKRKADPRSQERAQVTGRITAAGKPIAGAHVCADATTNEIARDAVCVDSDASGAYELDDLLATDYRLHADARGFKPVAEKLHLAAGAHQTQDLSLPAGGVELAGTVADIAGGPIAHAQLRAGDALGETDDQGKFSLWVDSGSLYLEVTADGYAPGSWNGAAPDHADVKLAPESSLSGTVVLASGEPLADAQVEISGTDWRMPTVDVTSGDDGTFHADRLAPGRYTITVRAPHAYGQSDGSVLVALAEHTDGVVVSVVPAYEITGTVTSEDGKPCDGSVRLYDEEHARTLDAYGADGNVELGGILPGVYKVTASCTGYLAHDAGDIAIIDKDVHGTWTVESGASVHGTVTMRDGSPAEGVEVRFQGPSWGTATTKADGTYQVGGLSTGTYTITASSAHGMQTEQQTVDIAGKDAVQHDLVLDPGTTIKGVLVDAHGAPVVGAFVRLRDVYGGAATSADGTFTITPALPGDHQLVVELGDRYLHRPDQPEDPEGAPDVVGHVACEAKASCSVRLVVEVQNAEIRGTVVDGNGAPLRDVVVELNSSSTDSSSSQLTGDTGAFRFPAVRGVRYRLRVSSAGRGDANVDVEAGDPITVKLQELAIAGIVRGAPDELTVTVSGTMYRTASFFRSGGKFAIHDLVPGRYTVTFDSPSGHTEKTVDLTDGPADPLDITLDNVFVLTGRVVDGQHNPVAGAKIQLRIGYHTMPDDGDGAVTDGNGRFTIKRAHAGTASVRVLMASGQTLWLETTVAGATLADDLVAEPPHYNEPDEGFIESE